MGSGGKGGGSTDTGPMLQYGNKALKLQEKIYNEQRADAQPWYQAGTSAVNQLSSLMGLSPSTSASSRQSLMDQYAPQFTSTSTTQSSSPAMNQAQANAYYTKHQQAPPGYQLSNTLAGGKVGTAVKPLSSGPQSTSTTDTAGLNSYIDNLLAQQGSESQSNPLFGSLAKSFSMDDYQQDPGYQFRMDEGNKALERSLNAQGKTYSPEAIKALQSYGQGLASEEYGNAYNRFNTDQGNLFNRLSTLSGFGQAAQGQNAQAGANYANAGSDLYTGMGNAITSANVANAANKGSMFNTLLGAGAQLGSAYMFSDERLKTDVVKVGEINGHNIYQFKYIAEPNRTFEGVIAQEVLETDPHAVRNVDGYLAVDYDALGLTMREVVTCH